MIQEKEQMEMPVMQIPAAVPVQRNRPTQDNIPPTVREREALRTAIKQYVRDRNPVPPLPMDELRAHADAFIAVTKRSPNIGNTLRY